MKSMKNNTCIIEEAFGHLVFQAKDIKNITFNPTRVIQRQVRCPVFRPVLVHSLSIPRPFLVPIYLSYSLGRLPWPSPLRGRHTALRAAVRAVPVWHPLRKAKFRQRLWHVEPRPPDAGKQENGHITKKLDPMKNERLASIRAHDNAFDKGQPRCVICGCDYPDDIASGQVRFSVCITHVSRQRLRRKKRRETQIQIPPMRPVARGCVADRQRRG
jgi:hypothetical protein